MLLAEDLAAFRGERLVLAGIGFAVEAGGALLLTGPNGAGKSTLLRVIAGLGRIETGRLLWDDVDLARDPAERCVRCAYLGHQDAIKPGLTAAENLRLAASRRPGRLSAAIAEALDRMALGSLADLPGRVLSAGQRRRLALARLMLAPAPLWLLDEPTLGLDAASVGLLGAALAAHRAGGGMVIAATHLPLPLPGAAILPMTVQAATDDLAA